MESINDYEKSKSRISEVETLHHFYLGQEVKTKEGTGIIVSLTLDYNGLHVVAESGMATVWYSTESSVKKANGGRWKALEYQLKDLKTLIS